MMILPYLLRQQAVADLGKGFLYVFSQLKKRRKNNVIFYAQIFDTGFQEKQICLNSLNIKKIARISNGKNESI